MIAQSRRLQDITVARYYSNPVKTLTGFLDIASAEQVASYLNESIGEEQWFWNIRPGNEHGAQIELSNVLSNQDLIRRSLQAAYKAHEAGDFSYCYLRLRHDGACSCMACECTQVLVSEPCREIAAETFGVTLRGHGGIFCSWYQSGCFLSPHFDDKNGRIAFVYQLAQGWRQEFGGSLCFGADDRSDRIDVYPAGFNNLVLFDVSQRLLPHFVSQVRMDVVKKRLAISGWYY
jgi:2OG-Fe(II) oxygenase superfamily